jgi:hypothetical protein
MLHTDSCTAYRRVILVEIGLAENGTLGIVPSAAEMWGLAQQIRHKTTTGGSRSGGLSGKGGTHKSPPSNSSDAELTGAGREGRFRKGTILKTTVFETSRSDNAAYVAYPEAWCDLTDTERGREDRKLVLGPHVPPAARTRTVIK